MLAIDEQDVVFVELDAEVVLFRDAEPVEVLKFAACVFEFVCLWREFRKRDLDGRRFTYRKVLEVPFAYGLAVDDTVCFSYDLSIDAAWS